MRKFFQTLKVKQASPGFSFIELLVSLGIFTSVAVIAATSYGLAVRLERKASMHRVIYQNASFFYEHIAKQVRNSYIDYSLYPGSEAPIMSEELWLHDRIDPQRSWRIYKLSNVVVARLYIAGVANESIWLTGEDVVVTSLGFFIEPARDCSDAAPANCVTQEIVGITISIMAANNSSKSFSQPITQDFQTAFSVRRYE